MDSGYNNKATFDYEYHGFYFYVSALSTYYNILLLGIVSCVSRMIRSDTPCTGTGSCTGL